MLLNQPSMTGINAEYNSPVLSKDFTLNNGSAVYTNKNINEPTKTFGLVMIVCLAIFVITLLLFSWLRSKFLRIYSPRLLLMQDEHLPHGKLPSSWFAWVSPALMARDDEIFNHLGLDAVVYIRFLRLLLKAAIFALPYGMFILIPLNVHGGMNLKEGLDKVSMSNVKLDSPKLWAHLIAVWVYSLTLMFIVHEEWRVYVLYRQIYLTRSCGKQHVLLVQDIPKEKQDDEKFEEYVNTLFPDQVHSVYVVKDLRNWTALIDKHNQLVKIRERIKAKQNESPDSSTKLLQPSSVLDRIERRMEILQGALQEEQVASHKTLPAAFVFFKSPASQATASQILWDFQAGQYQLSSAPDACEVIWKNLDLSVWNRCLRRIVSYVFIGCLIILWAVPITFIASLTNLQTLSKQLKFLDKFAKDLSTIAQGLIQGLLPVTLIAIFNFVLPYILNAIGRISGIVSKSATELFVFSSLTIFLICNTFFFFMLAGSFFSKIQIILDTPHTITEQLAISLPRQSNFYLCYVAFLAFIGNGFELTRFSSLCFMAFYGKCWAKTPRERLEGWHPGDPPYAVLLANDILVFLIGITYSVISPVIIPVILIHFGYRYIIWVYQLHYVYVQKIDLGGRLWPRVSSSMSAGVVIFQLLMIGVFTLKQAYWVVAFSVPLPFVTAAVWSYIHKRFKAVGLYLSKREGITVRNSSPQFLQNLYDSYVPNHSCPGLYEMQEEPDVKSIEAGERIPFHVEGQNGL